MNLLRAFLAASVVLVLLLFPVNTHAEEKINNFDVSITAHKDGTMTVQENIEYDFGEDFRHGIYRDIPKVSRVGELYRVIEIEVRDIKRDGKDEPFEIDNGPGEISMKIGDPDKMIDGVHNYIIIYTVKNGIGSNYETHDEIYWNITGNNWDVPIEKASANVVTDFGIETNRAACFTRDAAFNAQFCAFPPNIWNPVTTTNVMQPGEGLTVVYGFPVDTFPDSELRTSEPVFDPDFINFLKIYAFVLAGLNLILAPYLLLRYFRKKSKTRFGPATVNFDLPKADGKVLTPAEAGIIDNTRLEQNDIIATIFDLAIRKYIKIEEVKTVVSFAPDNTDYKITKLKPYDDLKKFEKELLDRLFKTENSIKLADLKSDFYLTFAKLEKEVFSELVSKKVYTKNPKNDKGLLMFLGILGIITANLILGPVLLYLAAKANSRTQLGDRLDWEVDGLKIFLKSVSRYHKFQSKNLITVEKYIPYAIALGLQEEFMDQLKIIAPEYSPGWYSGSSGSFYRTYPALYSGFGSSFTTSAPSSSSGFSGGSSGGGGGGGGGGSW